jgi:hypothetical protein
MSGTIPPLPQYVFMAWCLVKAQGQLCLHFISFTDLTLYRNVDHSYLSLYLGNVHYIENVQSKFWFIIITLMFCHIIRSRCGSVSIVTYHYGLDDRGSIPGSSRIILSSTASRPARGTHPASYPLDGGSFYHGDNGRSVNVITDLRLMLRSSMRGT